ncbi:MAG: hypothetical protein H7X84_05160 [Verrucomicrobia bacterium]|nr:hypothetical protein [Prolixibacteraceae bacterium]
MQIREITIGELNHFATSELWQQLEPKPITVLRAVSQSKNPRAKADDVALIIAYEGKNLAGLAGILPDAVNGISEQRASSNTCWWVNGDMGRRLALPLFMKAFAQCGQRMFLTDMTPHTLSILQKTNWFEFPALAPGMRGFLKFNLNEVLPARMPSFQKIKPLLTFSDKTLNVLFSPLRRVNQIRFKDQNIKVEKRKELNEPLYSYIEQHSQNEFIGRSGKELEWIVRYPWVTAQANDASKAAFDYPFSHIVKSFEQYFLHLSKSGNTIGLLLISLRDGHMKVPYAYFDEKNAPLILKEIYRQAVLNDAVTLTLFRAGLVNAMHSAPHPFIFRKPIRRLAAISTRLEGLFRKHPHFQDGDGDVVFT